ncbi:MAG: hypothetical protein DRJ98_03160 [Thermoprotei archaeon]|nr:MAG: hypothetical protein DRJ98_03160 [Thermoprotei archaeon]RLF16963.1 MAG: hypothetical protein DRN06_04555 [Thermoprotei archaeon]
MLERLLREVSPNRLAVTEDWRWRVEKALSKLGVTDVSPLIEEAIERYEELTYPERKTVGYLLTIKAEEQTKLFGEFNVGDLCKDIDYAFVEARAVKVRGVKARHFCGFKARDSEFRFEEVGYGFLSHSVNCVGIVRRTGLNAGFKAVNCRLIILTS